MNTIMFVPLVHIGDHPEEVPILVLLLTIVSYILKMMNDKRKDKKVRRVDDNELRRVEKKMEDQPDSTLSGRSKPNPGRKMIDLVEVIHDDQKEFKAETAKNFAQQNARLDKMTEDIGYLRGRIDGGRR